MKVNIISSYLKFLNEREVDAPTENPDAFDINVFKDAMTNIRIEPLHHIRHSLQPTLYGIYFKNALGDYRGRYDSINARTHQSLGVDQFERDMEELKKGEKYSSTYLPKETDTRLRFKHGGYPSEANDPDQFLSQYPAGDTSPIGGDGGGDGGAGGGGG
jgi:hypothetical protein